MYGDIALKRIEDSKRSSMEGTFFLGADGAFTNNVMRALKMGLSNGELEVCYHVTNSKTHNIMAVRCLHCNYCCSIAYSKHAEGATRRMRGSLARWLGVNNTERDGSACYATGQQNLFAAVRQLRNGARAPPGI